MCEFALFCPPWEGVAARPEVDKVEVKVCFIIRFNFKVYFSDYPPSPSQMGFAPVKPHGFPTFLHGKTPVFPTPFPNFQSITGTPSACLR